MFHTGGNNKLAAKRKENRFLLTGANWVKSSDRWIIRGAGPKQKDIC